MSRWCRGRCRWQTVRGALLLLLVGTGCGVGGGGDGGNSGPGAGEEDPPVAAFDAAPTSGTAPLLVSFTDRSTGSIDTWSWDFGDGAGSSAQSPTHTYTDPGTYTVSLTVTGPGGSDTTTLPGGITLGAGVSCEAEDATLNVPFPLKSETYDFVPVTPDGRGFWCVYSVRNGVNGEPVVGNNVGIFLLELDPQRVLMFGAGYGEILFNGEGPLFDAAFDMAMVDEVIQGCMGRDPLATTILFVAPHGHPDHINSAAFRELRKLGYAVSDIFYHQGDDAAIRAMAGWTAQDLAIFNALSGTACTTAILSMPADLGWVWFVSRPGHTNGSMDLVIDVDGDVNDRVVIYGSAPNTTCPDPPGTRLVVKAHGNVLLP